MTTNILTCQGQKSNIRLNRVATRSRRHMHIHNRFHSLTNENPSLPSFHHTKRTYTRSLFIVFISFCARHMNDFRGS